MPEVAPDTHEVALTDEVCLRIGNPADYVILVTRPTVKVTKVEAFEDSDIGGFVAQSLLTLMDGNGDTSIVVLPRNAAIGSLSGAHTINDNDVIRIDQMVRIPRADNESVVVVHSADVITKDFELILTDLEQEKRALQENTPQAVIDLAVQLTDLVTQATA